MMIYNKKKLSNEKRLNALKEWGKRTSFKNGTISIGNLDEKCMQHNNRVVYNDIDYKEKNEIECNAKNKLVLFNSSDSEDDDTDRFRQRPQFEGQNGQYLLEKSSEFSERFKLDERFKDDDLSKRETHEEEKHEIISERNRNIEILEQVVGYEIPGKELLQEKFKKKKQIMRFDPEDEKTSMYLKPSTQEKKKKMKKNALQSVEQQEVPISTEKYFEVAPDLKELLNSSTKFSLSKKFGNEEPQHSGYIDDSGSEMMEAETSLPDSSKEEKVNLTTTAHSNGLIEPEKSTRQCFFISDDDPRLKDGVQFFKRTEPLSEIYEGWKRKRINVLEIFKKRKLNEKNKKSKLECLQKRKSFKYCFHPLRCYHYYLCMLKTNKAEIWEFSKNIF